MVDTLRQGQFFFYSELKLCDLPEQVFTKEYPSAGLSDRAVGALYGALRLGLA